VEARWIACAVLLAAAGAAPAQEMEIRLAEKVNIAAEAGHAEFEAFGRHFSMELESNERALALIAFNIAEGIFDTQLNLLLVAGEYPYIDAANDPFTSDSASTLLEQLSEYRRATQAVSAKGIAHLFSGRVLNSPGTQ
jgi:hypothetical protein